MGSSVVAGDRDRQDDAKLGTPSMSTDVSIGSSVAVGDRSGKLTGKEKVEALEERMMKGKDRTLTEKQEAVKEMEEARKEEEPEEKDRGKEHEE